MKTIFTLILIIFSWCSHSQSRKPIDKPILFAEGIISTQFNELNSTFSPDGNTFLFTVGNNSYSNTFYTIFISERVNDKWSEPQIAPFSGQYSDADPFFSPDGKQIYFISYRPVQKDGNKKNDFDIWVVPYEKGRMGQPQHLGENVNSQNDELYPSVSSKGNLYFSTENGRNGYDLMISRFENKKYLKPESLSDSINSTAIEYDAFIAPDESFIIFTSIGRNDAVGSGDLYISHRIDEKWSAGRNIGNTINSSFMDQCPAISPDGKYLFFTSFRDNDSFNFKKPLQTSDYLNMLSSPFNGMGNIFWMECESILKRK
jgi:Tol biopolymer transport system component